VYNECALVLTNQTRIRARRAAKMPSCLKGHSQQITNAIKSEKLGFIAAQKETEMLKKKGKERI
jgi:hypothetical protein